ncbi:S-layer homology domain-containing protein [Paenibacillus sp. Sa2BVA9]|uniref:S-layer homology domain-containing protein n=2 Tax=Paenibacillus gallinarum TaxID=2762232 RepID=A0ABR8T0T2_9BACL|nr:S-layer homology domain-containing protein [Paenibacillus gallinarum]
MITALMNAYEYKTGQKLSDIPGYEEAEFRDISEVSAYAKSAVKAAKTLGIMEGNGGEFQPKEIATREQLAKMAVQFLKSTKQ